MFLIDDVMMAVKGGKLVAMLAGTAIVAAVGFGAAEVYEHKAPWGLMAQRDRLRDSIPGIRDKAWKDGAMAQFKTDEYTINTKWRPALEKCESLRTEASKNAAAQLDRRVADNATSRTAAYRLGQATCGANNAKTPTPGSGAASPVGVLDDSDDLASILSAAAYAPGRTGVGPSSRSTGAPGRAEPAPRGK